MESWSRMAVIREKQVDLTSIWKVKLVGFSDRLD